MLLSSESDIGGDATLPGQVFHLLGWDRGWSLAAPFTLILAGQVGF